MKSILLISLLILSGWFATTTYKPEDQGSSVQFTIRNLGFKVNGSISGLDGKIQFDPNDLEASYFDVTVDPNTVNTDNTMRDEHLRKENYFDTKNYPKIRFLSTRISLSGKKDWFIVTGTLMIKNQTKDISFPFSASLSNEKYLFKGTFKINRKDFGIGGIGTISDELEVNLNILADKV